MNSIQTQGEQLLRVLIDGLEPERAGALFDWLDQCPRAVEKLMDALWERSA